MRETDYFDVFGSAAEIKLEISLKDRKRVEQRVMLQCWINHGHRLHLVATSSQRELPAALNEVRDDSIRSLLAIRSRSAVRLRPPGAVHRRSTMDSK